jgi:metal-sulfur cluster biosynthetic enzyme
VKSVNLEMTFEPPFSPQMMSEAARLELGFM